jgi:hypothetical protein
MSNFPDISAPERPFSRQRPLRRGLAVTHCGIIPVEAGDSRNRASELR